MNTKVKMKVVLLLLSLVIFSCKDEKSVDDLEVVENKINTDNQFEVKLLATVKKDDKFQVYFSEEEKESEYKGENSVWVDVKGNESEQEISFLLPADVYPNYLRIDLGTNADQSTIKIGGVKVEYQKKEINAMGVMFFDYFLPNDCIKIEDKKTGIINQKKLDSGLYDPLFFSGETLKRDLKKLYQ